MNNKKSFNVKFHIDESGSEHVRKFLMELNEEDRKIVARDIKAIQLKWPTNPTIARPLGDNQWEIKSNLRNKVVHIIFYTHGENIVLKDAIIKPIKK